MAGVAGALPPGMSYLQGGGCIQSKSGQDSFKHEEDTHSVVPTNGSHCMGLIDQPPQGDGKVGNRIQYTLKAHLSICIPFFNYVHCVP